MNGNGIMVFIQFWAFMIGVAIFGKISGVMDTTRGAVTVLIAAALLFVVWKVARAKGMAKREERENENRTAARRNSGKGRQH